MFVPEPWRQVLDGMRRRCTIVLATPNYEERSIFFLSRLLKARIEAGLDPARAFVGLLWPRGESMRVDLLEQLKQLYYGRVRALLADLKHRVHVFPYPENYSSNLVNDFVFQAVEEFRDESVDVIVDISTMPRRVLVTVCTALLAALAKYEQRQVNLLFSYSSPEKYSSLQYAQNVGAVHGYFSGRPIHECRADHVSAVVFPSLQGYEGKLLFDELRNWTSRSISAFVAVGGRDYPTALAAIRANQFLMEQRDVTISYYYSLQDGIDKLLALLDQEFSDKGLPREGAIAKTRERLVIVAPFGPKVFTLAAFFALTRLHAGTEERCSIEIAHVTGFQYLSVYSLGTGQMSVWRMDTGARGAPE